MFVPFVVGVDHDGGIAEVGFGSRGGHHYIALLVGEGVADVVELSVVLFVLDLYVAERAVVGAPVHHIVAAYYQPLFVELDKRLFDGAFEPLVHREALTAPCRRDAQLSHLVYDHSAALLLPAPDTLQKLFAPQILFGFALGEQLLLHHVLRGYAGMVGAGLPECPEAVHPLVAHHDVLKRERKRVAYVQAASNVGRRHHYAEVSALFLYLSVAVYLEIAALFPSFVEFLFKFVRVVTLFFAH